MKITSPVKGYAGIVRVGGLRLDFVNGEAYKSPLPDKYRNALDAAGYTVTQNDGTPAGTPQGGADGPADGGAGE